MNKLLLVHLFHILFVGGLFLYVSLNAATMPSFMFPFLLYLGGFIILYHTYKIYINYVSKKSYNVNLFHVLLVGPLLMYIGYEKPAANKFVYQLLLMAAFAVIGYHGYYMIKEF